VTPLEDALDEVKRTARRSRHAKRKAREAHERWSKVREFTLHSVKTALHLDLYTTGDKARTCRVDARRALETYEELRQADLRARGLLCSRCQIAMATPSGLARRGRAVCIRCYNSKLLAYREGLPPWVQD